LNYQLTGLTGDLPSFPQWPAIGGSYIQLGPTSPYPNDDKDKIVVDPGSWTINIIQAPRPGREAKEIPLGVYMCKVLSGAGPYVVQRCNQAGDLRGSKTVTAEDPMGTSPAVGDIVIVAGYRDPVTRKAIAYIVGKEGGSGGGTTVKVSADDTTADYLENKMSATEGVQADVLAPGGDETLRLRADVNGLAAKVPSTADYALIYDVAGAAHKKALINNWPSVSLPEGGTQAQVLQKNAALANVWDYVRSI
jgi:hypothetical protein